MAQNQPSIAGTAGLELRRHEQVQGPQPLAHLRTCPPGSIGGALRGRGSPEIVSGNRSAMNHLRRLDLNTWAWIHAHVMDARDNREVQTICHVMGRINMKQLKQAMDACAQRILAIQSAKSNDGAWAKGEQMELIGISGGAVGPAGLLVLPHK